jgi:hypothetical protein
VVNKLGSERRSKTANSVGDRRNGLEEGDYILHLGDLFMPDLLGLGERTALGFAAAWALGAFKAMGAVGVVTNAEHTSVSFVVSNKAFRIIASAQVDNLAQSGMGVRDVLTSGTAGTNAVRTDAHLLVIGAACDIQTELEVPELLEEQAELLDLRGRHLRVYLGQGI